LLIAIDFTNYIPKIILLSMIATKEFNWLFKYGIPFIMIAFTACSTHHPYWVQKNKTDQILLGSVQKSILLKHRITQHWFEPSYNSYVMDTATIRELKQYVEPMQVLVFAGSWCSDTQRELPKFYRIADAIGLPEPKIHVHMLNEEKKGFYVNEAVFEVKSVPTCIFLKNGKEVGRIIEMSTQAFEKEWLSFYQTKGNN